MINWDKFGKKQKNILLIQIVVLLLILAVYGLIIYKKIQEFSYVNSLQTIIAKNEEPVFSVEKIYLCSSANAIYNTDEETGTDLNIYQYTDIAVYINNYQESNMLTNANTIKELYIDNIELAVNENEGNQYLAYTNILEIGSKELIPNFTQEDVINFQIVYTNEENNNADYDNPVFYTDCSNPITLRYINNLGTEYSLEEGKSSSFDGSILEDAGISVECLECKVKFKINIVSNEGEYFSCWLNFSLPLSDIYNGTTIKTTSLSGYKYNFFAS